VACPYIPAATSGFLGFLRRTSDTLVAAKMVNPRAMSLVVLWLKKLGGRKLQFLMEEIMGAQNLILPPYFPKMVVFRPQILHIRTKISQQPKI